MKKIKNCFQENQKENPGKDRFTGQNNQKVQKKDYSGVYL
jgi:hypothetical protein